MTQLAISLRVKCFKLVLATRQLKQQSAIELATSLVQGARPLLRAMGMVSGKLPIDIQVCSTVIVMSTVPLE